MKSVGIYDDIINLPHYVSDTRPQMDIKDRAAQFSPFAALTGYDVVIKESERLTQSFIELDEDQIFFLNEKLKIVSENIKTHPAIMITHFVPDVIKEGGTYIDTIGNVKKISQQEQYILMSNGIKIPIKYIYEIEIMEVL